MRLLLLVFIATFVKVYSDEASEKETYENLISEIEFNKVFVDQFNRFSGAPAQINNLAKSILHHLKDVGTLVTEIIFLTVGHVVSNTTYNLTLAGHSSVLFAQLVGVLDAENRLPEIIYTTEDGTRFESIINFTNSNYESLLETLHHSSKQSWLDFRKTINEKTLQKNIHELVSINKIVLDKSLFQCNQANIAKFCVASTNNLIKLLIIQSALKATKGDKLDERVTSKLSITKSCEKYIMRCY